MPAWKKVITSGSDAALNSVTVTNGLTITGSLNHNGTYNHTGSVYHSGSKFLNGVFVQSGSLSITGSTTQIGTNTLLGNTTLSGSIIMSGSATTPATPTIKVYGDMETNGVIKFMPVVKNIDTSISASYIYVSGSTNDLYFSQNSSGYNNVTRLRWIEGNLYTGLLHGGFITSQSSTVYQISSGSGVIVNLNASIPNDPFPTITYLQWLNLSASIAPLSASFDQSFIAITASNGNAIITAQGIPYTNGQYNTNIPIGIVLHQNHSTINAVQTFPSVGYGWKQRSYDFFKAFGPLKISGYTLTPSGSSTGSLVLSGGTAWVDGRNYTIDPNEPSYIVEASGITTSKIYRYHQSGSTWVYDTNAGVGYPIIDPANYSNNGVLTPVGTNDWSIQRVFYFPNSATKAFYIYYGNATYSSKDNAIAGILTETFSEAPNTTANAIFVGYMILRYNANFTTAASYEFRAGGLFRSSGAGGGGGGGTTTPGGTATQIQYNNSGVFGGVPTLIYDGTTLHATGSFTGSLVGVLTGTASFATQALSSSYSNTAVSSSYALSASYAPGGGNTFPYIGDAQISGSLGVTGSFKVQTYDAFISNAFVNAIQLTDTNRTLYDIFGNTSIDVGARFLIDNTSNPSLGWLSRTMFDSTTAQSIDWGNRLTYDGSGTATSLDWNNRVAFDATGNTSIDWSSRELGTSGGDTSVTWDYPTQAQAVEFNSYARKIIPINTVVEAFSNLPVYASFKPDGEILKGVNFDGTVANFDLVYLNTDNKWYPVDMTTSSSSKLLGIAWGVATGKESVLLEGNMIVNDSALTDSPQVIGVDHGLPIYIKSGTGTYMSTSAPGTTGNYVRILGHAYYQGVGDSNYWVMKFRPANDWYVI